jgi:hypothetical protein
LPLPLTGTNLKLPLLHKEILVLNILVNNAGIETAQAELEATELLIVQRCTCGHNETWSKRLMTFSFLVAWFREAIDFKYKFVLCSCFAMALIFLFLSIRGGLAVRLG